MAAMTSRENALYRAKFQMGAVARASRTKEI